MMTTTLDGVAIRTASLSSSIICAISQEDLRWAMPGQHQIRRCSSRADADQPLCAQITGPHAQPTNVAHRSLGLLRRNSFDVERVTVVWYTGRRLVGEAAIVSIAKRGDGRWRARYRDVAGKEHSRHFARKVDAQAWLDDVTTAVRTGTYADPRRGRVTVGDWAPRWLDGQAHLKPSTHERYAGILREHVLPHWSTDATGRRHTRGRADLDHAIDSSTFASDGAQDPSRLLAGAEDRGQGRPTRPQSGRRRQPASRRDRRTSLPDA